MSFVTSSWDDELREELHRALRAYYRENGMSNETFFPTIQAAFDHALAEARKGNSLTVNLRNSTGSVTVPSLLPQKADPPGVHVLGQLRIGDEIRDRYLDQVARRFSLGFMDREEYDARAAAIAAALTQNELDLLVRDLPAEKKEVIAAPPRRQYPVSWLIMSIIAIMFPVLSALTVLTGGPATAAVVLGLMGAVAALFAITGKLSP